MELQGRMPGRLTACLPALPVSKQVAVVVAIHFPTDIEVGMGRDIIQGVFLRKLEINSFYLNYLYLINH